MGARILVIDDDPIVRDMLVEMLRREGYDVVYGVRPKNFKLAQAGAAAGEALSLINAGFVELEPNTAYIVEEDCSGCKTCVPMCPYKAISFVEAKGKAEINEVLCKGCGACVAVCPSGSARQNLFEDDEIYEEIEGVLAYA